ncbi:hypothetical protein NX722_25255 [Endozoicomonas gorgoniicola]|uniref:Uncharacterized protein n=1 Tax=Endozoicomonas gorgoniicola TaxID=1234144 RepID=A0ABT3N2L2_9GAMM|nr:hypothetical protein [Endozoicomonas gorgoniicola]MCW7555875.1 hypothetical protein [Endozoicomonas gorgoniicola]
MNRQQQVANAAVEQELQEALDQIAAISETNAPYMAGLARRIAETGKDVKSLTVAELLALDARHNAYFNSLPL